MVAYIGDIIEEAPCVSNSDLNNKVDRIFTENKRIQGIVVLENESPVSFISRSYFYQKMGTLYGYHLYMGKSIELIINKDSLIIDYFLSIAEVSKLAMERVEKDRYESIIVTKEGEYAGVVSIEKLLMKLVDVQVEFASYLNPLTRLPGNHTIEEKLEEIILQKEFSVLYFDLDNFKAYNDTYGFMKGDHLLQSTAELLKKGFTDKGSFLGHIGGDDFIGLVEHHDIIGICDSLIQDVEKMIKNFYTATHLSQQYVITENRQGNREKTGLVSLSIAVVTNQSQIFESVEELVEYAAVVKKSCKRMNGSCYVINKLLEEEHG